jgi:hypothetical protein
MTLYKLHYIRFLHKLGVNDIKENLQKGLELGQGFEAKV